MKKLVFFAVLAGCGAVPPAESEAQFREVPFPAFSNQLVKYVNKRPIRVRIKGKPQLRAPEGTTAKAVVEKWVRAAVAEWSRPLKELDSNVLGTVEFVKLGGSSSDNPFLSEPSSGGRKADLVVDFSKRSGRSHYSLLTSSIKMKTEYGYHSYQTLLHEMGHAFGLGDTYKDARTPFRRGDSADRHPYSVMSAASSNILYPDDVQGVSYLFCKVNRSVCNHDTFRFNP